MREYCIKKLEYDILPDIKDKIDNLNKPKGSLGRLESLAAQVCLIQRTLTPELRHPCHLLFGGDHGIEREGVSATPREVTWQQMVNFSRGGGGVNMFCRQHGFKLYVIDVGVDHDLSGFPGIINRKIAYGTDNPLERPAMTQEQLERAMDIGAEFVDECHRDGCNVICVGEMGAGNTSPSSIWMSVLGDIPLGECIGSGSGLDEAGVRHKSDVLSVVTGKLLSGIGEDGGVDYVMRYCGGFEMVSAVGAMLRAAELRCMILVDGFIMTACALAACAICPDALDYMVFGHVGGEGGHKKLLDLLHAKPLLDLGMRLGEGTGALCAYPLLDSAVRMVNEMNNFDNAHITKYF